MRTEILRAALPVLAVLAVACAPPAKAQSAKPDLKIAGEIAPSGVLRAAINLGNPVLAQKDASGNLTGVSVQLAKALGQQLGLPVKLIPYGEAGTTFNAGVAGEWDVAFLAIDPQRAQQVVFTAPYVVIESTYMVWADSPYKTVADLDQPGVRITASVGSAYELYLSRALKQAKVVKTANTPESIATFRDQHLEATANITASLNTAVKGHPEWRIIEPGFSSVRQAVVLPKASPADVQAYVGAFIEQKKASGFVRKALDDTGQTDATVAPPGG